LFDKRAQHVGDYFDGDRRQRKAAWGLFEMLNLPVFLIWIPATGVLLFGSIAMMLFRRKEVSARPK
jgi:hypothetical protein